jgi:hypothetical protein
MSIKLGVFLNNTKNESDYLINYNNYENLKDNFDKIIIIDLDTKDSSKLKNSINNSNSEFIIYNNESYMNKIIHMERKIQNDTIITFIQDKHIYVNSLSEYFRFILNSNYDFYSFTDSTEKFYHMQLYLFSIKKNLIDKFIKAIKIINDNNEKSISYTDSFLKYITELFDNKAVFVKVAYLDINYDKNILLDDNDFYYELLEKDILPVINVDLLYKYLDKFNDQELIFNKIPDNFNIDIYRIYEDTQRLNEEELKKHFLENGQFECRKYNNKNHIQNNIIYDILKKNKLLKYFDFPDNFDLYYYKKNNKDLELLNIIKLKNHWFEFGINEDRSFSEKNIL